MLIRSQSKQTVIKLWNNIGDRQHFPLKTITFVPQIKSSGILRAKGSNLSFSWLIPLKAEIYMLVRIVVVMDVPMHQKKHHLSVLFLIGSQFITTIAHFIGLPWLYLLLKSYFSHWKNNEKMTFCWYLKTISHINMEILNMES